MSDLKGSTIACNAGTFATARMIILSLAAAVSLMTLTACVTKTAAPSTVPIVSFQLVPPSSLPAGGQTQLIAVVTNDPKMMGVDWIASCVSTNCGSFFPTHTLSGQPTIYTAPSAVPQGGVNLQAKATALPAQTAVVNVAIFTNVSIKLTGFPASPLGAGSTTTMTAVVTGDPNNPPLGVNWSIGCNVANCGTLSAPNNPTGIAVNTASDAPVTYMAPQTVTAGFTVTIFATPAADLSQTINTSIMVTTSSAVSISITPLGNIQAGATVNITATVTGDPHGGGVTWSVTCTNSASPGNCGTFATTPPTNPPMTASGAPVAYTAPTTVPAAGLPITITATSTDSSAFANVSTTVTSLAPSVTITTFPTSVPVSTPATFVATILNDTGLGVNWTATCSAATGSTCGSFTPLNTLTGVQTSYQAPTIIPGNGGVVTITATTVATPVAMATKTITIVASTAVSIAFTTPPPASLNPGQVVTNITAFVTNDPTTGSNGVAWSVVCTAGSGGDCGMFSSATTANGVAVQYTAPIILPVPNTVTIVATAQAAPSPSVMQTVTITPPTLSVAINPPIPTAIQIGTTVQFGATVTHDTTPPSGVDWSVTCTGGTGTNPCGSFNPTHTVMSTDTTTYTPPSSVPTGNSGDVVITATSAAPGVTASANATVQITPNTSAGLLNGHYALIASGQYATGFFGLVGSIIADGMGGISMGEEDIDSLFCGGPGSTTSVSGSYSIGSDGRGTMTLMNTEGNTCFGANGVQTVSFAITGTASPAQHVLISEFDGGGGNSGSGSLDLQTIPATIIGNNYAFVFDGFDVMNNSGNVASTTDMGGTLAVASSSITMAADVNDLSTGTVGKTSGTLTYTTVDGFGRATATSAAGGSYVFYVVNAGQIDFLEDDANFVEIGPAYAQGTFTPGNFVFTLAGVDAALNASNAPGNGAVVAGGAFTATSNAISPGGIFDFSDNGGTPDLGLMLSGTLTAPTSGRGTLTVTLTGTTVPAGISQFAFYPTANNGLLLLELDTAFATFGQALPQPASVTTSDFSGNYATNFTNATLGLTYLETDAVGQVIADGNSSFTSGTLDFFDTSGNFHPGVTVMGSFAPSGNAGQGRFTGNFMINTTNPVTLPEIFYVVDNNTVLFISTNNQVQTRGVMLLQ